MVEHQRHKALAMMTARKIKAVEWKNSQTATVAVWKQKLRKVFGIEALTAKLQLKSDVFGSRWLLKRDASRTEGNPPVGRSVFIVNSEGFILCSVRHLMDFVFFC